MEIQGLENKSKGGENAERCGTGRLEKLATRCKALTCIHISCFFFILVHALAKICTNNGVNVIDFSFIRIFSNLIFSVYSTHRAKKHIIRDLDTMSNYKVLVIRSVAGVFSFSCLVYSLKNLPMFLVNIILNTVPFWCSILSYIFLRERVTKTDILCIFGCFTGVFIIAYSQSQSDVQGVIDDENGEKEEGMIANIKA